MTEEALKKIGRNVLKDLGIGVEDRKEKVGHLSHNKRRALKSLQVNSKLYLTISETSDIFVLNIYRLFKRTAFGHKDTSFYGLALEKFERKDLRDAGYSDLQARKLLERLGDREFPEKKVRADSHKNPAQTQRNDMVTQFLEEDSISTVSDRTSDQRLMDGQHVTLRFLNFSVQATHQLLSEMTGIMLSESVFRQLLVKNKHIKTTSRQRKTAVCRQMIKII